LGVLSKFSVTFAAVVFGDSIFSPSDTEDTEKTQKQAVFRVFLCVLRVAGGKNRGNSRRSGIKKGDAQVEGDLGVAT